MITKFGKLCFPETATSLYFTTHVPLITSLCHSSCWAVECRILPLESVPACYSDSSGSDSLRPAVKGWMCSRHFSSHLHTESYCHAVRKPELGHPDYLMSLWPHWKRKIAWTSLSVAVSAHNLAPPTIWPQLSWSPWARTASWELPTFLYSQNPWDNNFLLLILVTVFLAYFLDNQCN